MTTADHQLPEYSASLPLALMRACESVMRHFRPVLADHDLTEQQWRVLRALDAADEGLEVGELAERAFLLGPSLSRMLAALERRELVGRHQVPGDQRRSRMAITVVGREVVASVGARTAEGYEHIEERFGTERLATLRRLLAELALIGPDSDAEPGAGLVITLDAESIAAEARRLDEAERSRSPATATTSRHPEATIDDAYAIQEAWIDLKLARGRTLVGHKIGLTSRAMQLAMGIDTPDSGVLLDDMVFEDGSELEAAAFCDPRVEVELAFVLADDLGQATTTPLDVLAATEWVVPAVELIAARTWRVDPTTGRARTVVDTISDNAANAGIVTGGRPVRPDAVDLRWVGAVLMRNGVVEETGVAAGVLNDPARGVAWLARRYAEQGRVVRAGQLVLAGSFTRPVAARAGDTFHADFGPLGAFGFSFS